MRQNSIIPPRRFGRLGGIKDVPARTVNLRAEKNRRLICIPPLLDSPTRDDAARAASMLEGLISEFPFTDGASKSVALSCLITPVVRGAFSVTPMHAIRASTAGTGKSFLLDVAAAITIGQPCPVMSAGATVEETEKRLGAALLASQPIISIDNVNGDLGGERRCQYFEKNVYPLADRGLNFSCIKHVSYSMSCMGLSKILGNACDVRSFLARPKGFYNPLDIAVDVQNTFNATVIKWT